ncbi:hypothetical protein Droror1_Dr00015864 [Drosera rotundifolia]
MIGGTMTGGRVIGGLMTGGNVIGGTVTGGRVIGGLTTGGNVIGGRVIGGLMIGGTVIGGMEMGGFGRIMGLPPLWPLGLPLGCVWAGAGLPQYGQPKMGVAVETRIMEIIRRAEALVVDSMAAGGGGSDDGGGGDGGEVCELVYQVVDVI